MCVQEMCTMSTVLVLFVSQIFLSASLPITTRSFYDVMLETSTHKAYSCPMLRETSFLKPKFFDECKDYDYASTLKDISIFQAQNAMCMLYYTR